MDDPRNGSRPRACGAVIRDGKVLMVRHVTNGRTYWTLPGGGVQPGETFEQAAVREMAEETGLRTRVVRLLFENRYEIGDSMERCFLMEETVEGQQAVLGADPEQAALPVAQRELQAVEWIALDTMQDDGQIRKVLAGLTGSR